MFFTTLLESDVLYKKNNVSTVVANCEKLERCLESDVLNKKINVSAVVVNCEKLERCIM